MKKYSFYSLCRQDGKTVAKLQNGYTDGTYNYYKGGLYLWFCIDPQTGMSIAQDDTRKQAQAAGQRETAGLEEIRGTERYQKLCEQFREARAAAKTIEL